MRLRTLGGIYVATEAGELITGAATQRRLLALLAALAVAGDRGYSREKLAALLWPEVEEDRARHSLTQALYGARRALGLDDLFLSGGDIRLNRQHLRSDVQDLEEALEQGDLERVVALYTGPFADGFFLPGSGQFEQWISAQRSRLEDQVVAALDRLARRAEEAGQLRDALDWRKRLAAIRPLDTSAAVALMTTLANAGDRAGALQHARLHETLLREELGLAPEPSVTALVARLRESADWMESPRPVALDDPGPESGRGIAAAGESEPGRERLTTASDWTGTHRPNPESTESGPVLLRAAPRGSAAIALPGRVRHLRWWWAVPAVGLILAMLFLLRRQPGPVPAASPPPLDQRVVVAPFRVAGASGSLAYLREGMVELLSARLADDSSARSVDAGAVLAAWRANGLGSPTDAPRASIVALARGLGAERVVIGSVVGGTSRLVLTATVVETSSSLATGRVTVEGPADSLTALVDRLAGRLLVLGAGEEASLSDRTTESLSALRAFLAGQAAFRRASYPVAIRNYEDALRLDSTFALAAVQLARAADRVHALEPLTRGLALAWREREALDARARSLLTALAGPAYPLPSDGAAQVDAWERLIDLTPDRAESWFELGARLLQEGPAAGLPDAHDRGAQALRRALLLDGEHGAARELLAAVTRDSANVASTDSALPLAPFLAWQAAFDQGDSAALGRLRRGLADLGPRNLRAIAVAAQLDAPSPEDARLALQQLRARATRLDERLDAALGDHALALNQGRPQDALAATERLAQMQPGAHIQLRLRVLDALYGDGDPVAAAAAAVALRRFAVVRASAEPATRALQLADACVLAQWQLRQADTTGVRRTIAWLREDPLEAASLAPPVAAGPLACAELLQAGLAVVLAQPDASRLVARLDSLAFTAGVSGDAVTYAPGLIARLHDRLGDARGALDAVRRRDVHAGWPRYAATQLRQEGRYALEVGAAEEAGAAFRRYLALRTQPDSSLRQQVEEVRGRLTAAGGRR